MLVLNECHSTKHNNNKKTSKVPPNIFSFFRMKSLFIWLHKMVLLDNKLGINYYANFLLLFEKTHFHYSIKCNKERISFENCLVFISKCDRKSLITAKIKSVFLHENCKLVELYNYLYKKTNFGHCQQNLAFSCL